MFSSFAVDCNLVDCMSIIPADCDGAAFVPADPSIGRCCDTCGEASVYIASYTYTHLPMYVYILEVYAMSQS